MTTPGSALRPRQPAHAHSASLPGSSSAFHYGDGRTRKPTGKRPRPAKDSSDSSHNSMLPLDQEAAQAPRRAQSFRVGSVQHNGQILLRPVQQGDQGSLAPYHFPAQTSGSARHQSTLHNNARESRQIVNMDGSPLRQPQSLRLVVNAQNDWEDGYLQIPIPSHKLGRPRFSARGSAFLSLTSYRSSASAKSVRASSEWSLGQFTGQFPVPPCPMHANTLDLDENRASEQLARESQMSSVVVPPETVLEVREEELGEATTPVRETSLHTINTQDVSCFRPHWRVRRFLGSVRKAWRMRRPHLGEFISLRAAARRKNESARPPSRAASIALCNFGWQKRASHDQGARPGKSALRRSRSAPGLSLAPPEGPLSTRITSDMTMGSRSIIIVDGTDTNPTAAASREMSPRDTYYVPPSIRTDDGHARSSRGEQMVPIFYSNPDVDINDETNDAQASSEAQGQPILMLEEGSITTAELLQQGSMLRLSLGSIGESRENVRQSALSGEGVRRSTQSGKRTVSIARTSSFNPTTQAPNHPPRPMTTYDSYETLTEGSRNSLVQSHAGATYLDDTNSDTIDTTESARQQRNLRRLPGGSNLRKAENVHDLDVSRASVLSDGSNAPVPASFALRQHSEQRVSTANRISQPSSRVRSGGRNASGNEDQRESGLSTFFIPDGRSRSSFSQTADLAGYEDDYDNDPIEYPSDDAWSIPSVSSYRVAPLRVINRSQSHSPANLLALPTRDAPLVPKRASSQNALSEVNSLFAPSIPERSSSVTGMSQAEAARSMVYRGREEAAGSRALYDNPLFQRSLSAELAAIAGLPDSPTGDGGVDEALAKLEGRSSTEHSTTPSFTSYTTPDDSPVSIEVGKAI